MEEDNRILEIPQYDIEIWDAKSQTYVADISNILSSDLNIEWTLNDVESFSFSVDLVQFEKKCEQMGVKASEVMTPYVHDIRIRRNGEYIVGGQVVEQVFNISADSPTTMDVRCTGFLNLFKDQYIDAKWSGYSYAEIAKKLVMEAQQPDNLAINGTFDIDTTGWLASSGTLTRQIDAPRSGDGYLKAVNSSNVWITVGTQIKCPAGSKIKIVAWAKWQSSRIMHVRERQYMSLSGTQKSIYDVTKSGTAWQKIEAEYTTYYDDPYIAFDYDQSAVGASYIMLDDVSITLVGDEASYRDLNVTLGIDDATEYQKKDKQRNYELQNVKDAIIELTGLEDDNFDFDFSADRKFNVYAQKGRFVDDVEVAYPGNVDTMTITRSAAALANKVIAIGSGIGRERMQVDLYNHESQRIYGTHETMFTSNNVSLKETLTSQAIGVLYDSKDPVNLPTVTVRDGSINPGNTKVGDIILVKVDNDPYLDTINAWYRIARYSLSVDGENMESVSLTLEPEIKRPEKKIRYIKDIVYGSERNTSGHWVEIQAYKLVGNELINVAKGKPVSIATGALESGNRDSTVVTDGAYNNSESYFSLSKDSSGASGVIIDLGEEISIDHIRVWHFYGDGRTYKKENLSVGKTLKSGATPLDDVLISDAGDGPAETSVGRKSRWIQGDEYGSI